MTRHYKELTVWQRAMDLVTEVYRVTADSPNEERFGLVSQIRRAAVSFPSNIAEGQGRMSQGEFRQFLGHARGSLFEVETKLLIARELKWLKESDFTTVHDQIDDVGRLLNSLVRSISGRTPSN